MLAETGHSDEDEARIDLRETLVVEAPFLQRARPKVLDPDVGPGDEPADDLLAGGGRQIERLARLLRARATRAERRPW